MADSDSSESSVTSSARSNQIKDKDQKGQERLDFLTNLPESVRKARFNEIMDLICNYRFDKIETVDFEIDMLEIIKGHPNQVANFKKLLPTAAVVPPPGAAGDNPDKQTAFVNKGNYADRVRDALCNDNDIQIYTDWLKLFQNYSKGLICFEEFQRKVETLFTAHPDLCKELPQIFDKELHQNVDEGKTDAEPSTSSDTEVSSTAPKISSKRRKSE